MPSSYTTNTGIEKPATGEQSGTWGDTVNTNSDILDRALNGVGTIDLSSSGAAHTLTTTDGTLSDGQYRVLVLSGATEACTITVSPNDAQKVYFINNTSGFDCTFSQGSGSNVTISNGQTGVIYANGGGASASVIAVAERLSGLLVAASNLSDVANTSTARTNLGLAIGTNVQAYDAGLQSISGLSTAANKMIYTTASDTYAVTDLSAFARTLLDDADATAFLATLGVTASAAELNYNDITTLGTSQASKVVTADANGVVTFDNGVTEEFTAVTSSSNAVTVNCHDGTVFSHTLTENTTFTFSNPAASGRSSGFALTVVQDAGASGYTVTWPGAVVWPNGVTPALTSTANAVDQFVFYTTNGGTTWYGFQSGLDMS
jgi:hypothetical protein